MRTNILLRILVPILLASVSLDVQGQSYAVERAEFNSDKDDDYSPVGYEDGLVFCSNRKHDVIVVYASPDNKESANLWFVGMTDSV